jgi:DNA-binding transcriptional LysR family regulator
LAAAESVIAADLADAPVVTLSPGNLMRRMADAALDRAGLTMAPPVVENDNLFEVMRAVQDGQGYFASFGPLARDFGKAKGIVRLAYTQGLPQVEVRQAVRPEMMDDEVVCALAEYLFR